MNSRWESLRTVRALIRKFRLPRQAAIKTLESINVRVDLLVISSAAKFLHDVIRIEELFSIVQALFGERQQFQPQLCFRLEVGKPFCQFRSLGLATVHFSCFMNPGRHVSSLA